MRQLSSLLLALPLILALPAAPFALIQQEAEPDSARAESSPQEAAVQILPDPAVSIALDPSLEGSLRSGLVKLAASAGVNLFVSPAAEQQLGSGASFLQSAVEVPASEAWSFIESLMVENGLMLCIHRSQMPRLVSVHSVTNSSGSFVKSASYIADDHDLEQLGKHPALLTSLVVSTENLDVRNLVNSLRALSTDGSRLTMLPAGSSNSMILTGYGLEVMRTTRAIHRIDEAAGKQRASWDAEREAAGQASVSE